MCPTIGCEGEKIPSIINIDWHHKTKDIGLCAKWPMGAKIISQSMKIRCVRNDRGVGQVKFL